MNAKPIIVGICGIGSNVGKTTLMCDLLREFPGWEAIKITRGHYRSCGRNTEVCCVSHLLSDEPVIYSEKRETQIPGKDTGRYWAAGASNVHWLIVTKEKVDRGIRMALERVRAPGVFVEGTSFLDYVDADFALMVARADVDTIKPSAKRVIGRISALYVSTPDESSSDERLHESPLLSSNPDYSKTIEGLPIYSRALIPRLVEEIRLVSSGVPV